MIGIEEARTRFSTLVREAAGGRSITITVYGKPYARLVPPEPPVPQGDALGELRALRSALDRIQPHIQRLAEEKT